MKIATYRASQELLVERPGLPADAMIVSAQIAHGSLAIELTVHSATFDDIPEGYVPLTRSLPCPKP